jgi:hypothetical protein
MDVPIVGANAPADGAAAAADKMRDEAFPKPEPVVTAPAQLALYDLKQSFGKAEGSFSTMMINGAIDFLSKRQDVTLPKEQQDKMVEMVQSDHFRYFQENQHPDTGLIFDRSTKDSPSSIAAVGFGLTCYPVAVDRQWISRDEARDWTLKVLKTLSDAPQGDTKSGTSGTHGYFYHMLNPATGLRTTADTHWDSELSSVDTALLMMGVLYSKEYFNEDNPKEREIRTLADNLYKRVEWDWLADKDGVVHLSWSPEQGKSPYRYRGYNEAIVVYLLGLGSPTHPLPDTAWKAIIGNEKTEKHYGQEYVRLHGSPLFTYQYPHTWIDFRNIKDDKAREMGFDWFENSRRATIAQHEYAKENPNKWKGYGPYVWGQTASDGPGWVTRVIEGKEHHFSGYRERGSPLGYDDGTIAPTAALASAPFAPELVMPTMVHWLRQYPDLYTRHGFADAFNPTVDAPRVWVNKECIGIDQGPIMLMLENQRTGKIWETMCRNAYLQNGLRRAGFTGGWLEKPKN